MAIIKFNRKFTFAIIAAFLAISAVYTWKFYSPPSGEEITGISRYNRATINHKPVIKVRGDHQYPPFEYLDVNGQPAGFNVEIIKSIAEAMHLNTEIDLGPWDEVREDLESGRIDAITGMYQTKERRKKTDFTIPHFISSYVIFTRKDSKIQSKDDLQDKIIIVQNMDLGHDYVIENKIGSRIITKQNWESVLTSLSKGEGDCAIAAHMQGAMLIEKLKLTNITTDGSTLLQKNYSIAVKKGNSELLSILNEGLSIIKSSGEYDKIFEKWFGIYKQQNIFYNRYVFSAFIILCALLLALLLSALWSRALRKQVMIKTEALTSELEHSAQIQKTLKISKQEALEAKAQAEEASESKSQFMAKISHELRTPLHGIIGMADLLGNTPLSKEQMELLSTINISAENLYRIISDLLDFSGIKKGTLKITKAPFRADKFLKSTIPLMKYRAEEKNLEFIADIEGCDKIITTDEGRLNQIFLNLVLNAVKYTDSGTVTVKVRCTNTFKINIIDTGRGIPEDRLTEIFDPFIRVNSRQDFADGGLGLGLSIVKLLVELMDGSIEVSSTQGKGSDFSIEIPLESSVEETPVVIEPEESRKNSLKLPGNIKILVAEDETINRIYLERIFAKKGITVDTAENGKKALQLAGEKNYDIILMDLSMPEMDGIESAEKIIELKKDHSPLIIALTANVYPEDIKKCFSAGMKGYVSKPFHPTQLFQEINRVMEESRELKEIPAPVTIL